MDYPRDEITRRADAAIRKYGPSTLVYFKFTCERCGERCTFQDANMLWEEGECHACGLNQPVTKAGFALHWKAHA